MEKSTVQRQILFLFITILVHATGIDGKIDDRETENKPTEIHYQENMCNKQDFIANYQKKNKRLFDRDYHQLRNCVAMKKKCHRYPGTLSITYGESGSGILFIRFQMYEIAKQDCWGYALQLTEQDSDGQTFYFNFNGTKTRHVKIDFNFRLSLIYNFTVTPLPTGKPLTIMTKAPTLCEMGVIDEIYYSIEKGKIFKGCNLPSYQERKEVATKICDKFPTNIVKRLIYAKNHITEEQCKFVLRENNHL